MNINKVLIDKKAVKDLRKIPSYIIEKLNTWILLIEKYGVLEVRKMKSYHDEPLKGDRKGQRSLRLNKAYRAFYVEHDNGDIEISHLEIIGVNKHEY
jgi:proteic killer suppression protein